MTTDQAHRQNGAKTSAETPQESAAPICSVQRNCSPVGCVSGVEGEGLGNADLEWLSDRAYEIIEGDMNDVYCAIDRIIVGLYRELQKLNQEAGPLRFPTDLDRFRISSGRIVQTPKDSAVGFTGDVEEERWDKACLIITNTKDSEDVVIMSSIDGVKHHISKEYLRRVVSNQIPSRFADESSRLT